MKTITVDEFILKPSSTSCSTAAERFACPGCTPLSRWPPPDT